MHLEILITDKVRSDNIADSESDVIIILMISLKVTTIFRTNQLKKSLKDTFHEDIMKSSYSVKKFCYLTAHTYKKTLGGVK